MRLVLHTYIIITNRQYLIKVENWALSFPKVLDENFDFYRKKFFHIFDQR